MQKLEARKIRGDKKVASSAYSEEGGCTNNPSFLYAVELFQGLKEAERKRKPELRNTGPTILPTNLDTDPTHFNSAQLQLIGTPICHQLGWT